MACLLAVLLVATVPVAGRAEEPPGGPAQRAAATRVLLLGDSVTHGSAGDWTWRYRLWRHLRTTGEQVDLVGPDRSLAGPTGSYADRRFDRDHAALWGRWASWPVLDVDGAGPPLVELMSAHRPHVLVVMLGINDLLYGAPVESVLWCLEQSVLVARSVDPGVDVVLSEITQTWFAGGRPAEVNAGLGPLARRLSTPRSRVTVARAAHGYRVRHTYDGSHPSAQGEVRVAAAVADALADLGVGRPHRRPLPRVANVPRRPVDLRARAGRRAVRLSWTAPPGATSIRVWRRDRDTRRRWRLVGDVAGTRLRVPGLRPRHRYEFRVRARKGTAGLSEVTARVAVRTRR